MPTPSVAGNCVVYGSVVDARQKPEKSIQVIAIREDSSILVGGKGVSNRKIVTYTNNNGYFQVELAQGQLVSIEIPVVNIKKKFYVPVQDDIEFFGITEESPP
jgi:hypothetical protein